jgi:esterase/lipase superfamily enzyme
MKDYFTSLVNSGSVRTLILIFLFISLVINLISCASKNLFEIDLMPAPHIYEDGVIDPFSDTNPIENIPYSGILYATDRLPASDGDKKYLDKRGGELRLGTARIELGTEEITWEEARRISLLKNRTDKYPLKVTQVEEIGILDRSFSVFTPSQLIPDDPHSSARRFAAYVNEKLEISSKRDIYIYVHGFKVVFENPLLVAMELWHFLGYDGVFIAFSWPSTPSTWAYASDLETAVLSSHNLRIFLEYLAEETHAERIHIIGYSAGTRVVISALAQLTFIHKNDDRIAIQQQYRLGHVILVGSDFDRHLFGAYLVEGMMETPETLNVYISEKDKALGISRWLFRRERLGQKWTKNLDSLVGKYLHNTPALRVIDVTEAEGAETGNGHAYFRKSPWTSSDILMTLMYDLTPQARGLVQDPENPIWTFPADYIQRLKKTLLKINSNLYK